MAPNKILGRREQTACLARREGWAPGPGAGLRAGGARRKALETHRQGGWRSRGPSAARPLGRTEQALRSVALASWVDNWTWAPGAAGGAAWPLPRGPGTGPLVLEQVHRPSPLPGRRLAPCPALAPAPNQSGGASGTAEPSAAGTGAPVARVPGKGVPPVLSPWGPGRPSRCRPGPCCPLRVAQTIGLQTGERRENWGAPPQSSGPGAQGQPHPCRSGGLSTPPQRSPQLRPQQPRRPGPRAASPNKAVYSFKHQIKSLTRRLLPCSAATAPFSRPVARRERKGGKKFINFY